MTTATRKTASILIDVQNGLLRPTHWGTSRSTPQSEKNVELLWQSRNYNDQLVTVSGSNPILICHVHHRNISLDFQLHPTTQIEVDGRQLQATHAQGFAVPRPGETVRTHSVNSAFIGTGLEAFLKENLVRRLVMCGLTINHCVSTSTCMASNLRVVNIVKDDGSVAEKGDIVLVGDTCATYAKGRFDAETVHQINLASLKREFAQVKLTKGLLENVFTA